MVGLRFDTRDFQRAARNMGALADQIPFALAVALNKSADTARNELPQVWAQHITARNPNFLKAALTTKGARANKRSLRVELYDQYGRGNLNLHDLGGTAHGRGALAIATTTSNIKSRRGPKGVPKGLRPRGLPNSFAKPGTTGDLVIYQRTGKYRKASKKREGQDGRGLKLQYVTHPTTRVPADVPLRREFVRIMRREMPKQFAVSMKAAMATVRKK